MQKEQEIQQKYILLQMIDNQMKQIDANMQEIAVRNEGLISLKAHLDELNATKSNVKLKAPIGAGIYVDAELKNTKDVYVNVGAGIVVKKTIAEAKNLVDKQITEVEKAIDHLGKGMENLSTKAQETQHELQHLMGTEHEH
ncbi:MAG: prefoldin subunit alpha [DPANN group archaeon]|nr:prefoldin subunit alpha [DPANN group archaeon]